MIIGIDASRANKTYKTGTEWYSYHLIRELAQLDKENEYNLYFSKFFEKGFLNLAPNFQAKILSWPPRLLWTQIRLSYEMKKKPPHLLFIPSHVVPLIHPPKVLTTIHDIAFRRYPEVYTLSSQIYLRLTTKFALLHATKIITPSLFTKNELVEIYGADPLKICVIPHGYDDKNYKIIPDQKALIQILNKYNLKKPFIMTLGRLEEKKNLSLIIEAFSLLLKKIKNKEIELILVGTPGVGYQKIKEKISQYNLGNQVRELGWVSEDDLPYLLNSASIFLFVSLYEGFGLPLLEAMACGVPIIASSKTAIPEVVGEAALLVDPGSSKGIVQAMERLMMDQNLQEILKKRGLERVKKFSWRKCASETMNLLENLL